jgi:hypothetical protein
MRAYASDSPLDPSQPAGQAADATLPQDVRPGQAVDASQQSSLGKLWSAWTSRPENNAAMINFGLQLMQPRAPGQSALGAWAQAVGAGAEASQRNVAAEEARQQEEQKMGLAERKVASEEELSKAHSQYYLTRNTADKLSLRRLGKADADWNRWRMGKDSINDLMDPTITNDTTTNVIRKMTGKKDLTKSQILLDPALSNMAERMIRGESPPTAGGAGMAPEDAQAMDWAKTHPDDPRAAQILQRLGK